MYLINIFNYNGLDSDNAVALWNGRDLSIVKGISDAYFCDNDASIYADEIYKVLEELKTKLDNTPYGVSKRVGSFCIYLYPAIEGKVFDSRV